MGTKRALTRPVGEAIRGAQSGVMLDAFSGMCSVGETVGVQRPVWNNDVQKFAAEVARALFTSRGHAPSTVDIANAIFHRYDATRRRLMTWFEASARAERHLINATSFSSFQTARATLQGAHIKEVANCRSHLHRLFSVTYAGTYFGVEQAIGIDSIVSGIESAVAAGRLTIEEARWSKIALGRTLLKIASSTGHFAQYLKPKEATFKKHIQLRARSTWDEWLSSLSIVCPVGTGQWRKTNRVFNEDSLRLLGRLRRNTIGLSVVYADPPYTDDQYSRYYHILETLLLYDYPEVTGTGLYRPGRFRTPFSVKTQAAAALSRLIYRTQACGADLVLSYPSNGLAIQAGMDVMSTLRSCFRHVEIVEALPHRHSTFGASKGAAKTDAMEMIYLARH